MGWGSGSWLFSEIISALMEDVPDVKARDAVYRGLINAFLNHDCDTLGECYGEDPVFDAIWDEMYPREDEEYNEESEDPSV